MSKRWRFQIKIGIVWAILYVLFYVLLQPKTVSFYQRIENQQLIIQFFINLIAGVFIFGSAFWKMKKEKSKK